MTSRPAYLASLPTTAAVRAHTARNSSDRDERDAAVALLPERPDLFAAVTSDAFMTRTRAERRVLGEAVWVYWLADSRHYRHREWRAMFTRLPYRDNTLGAASSRPHWPTPRTLYRGSGHSQRRGLAWTPHLPLAAVFAVRHATPGVTPRVWVADVDSARLFGLEKFGVYEEYVLDTRSLTLAEYAGPPIRW